MAGEALFAWSKGLVPRCQASSGALQHHRVAVKDVYDVAGLPTSYGCPKWLDVFPSNAECTAPPVKALLTGGASFVGKAQLDELASSLQGENVHYGTPYNAAAPGRVPGGSSSGSASAVITGTADIGLGSDTAGSVRIPSSFCNIFGLRATHGSVSLENARALAPSFDAAGWMARSAHCLLAAGEAIFATEAPASHGFNHFLIADDAFNVADTSVQDAFGPVIQSIEQVFPSTAHAHIADSTGGLPVWRDAFRKLQPYEVWQTLGWFVEQYNPTLGPSIQDRMDAARAATAEQAAEGANLRHKVTQALERQLGESTAIIVPSAPGPPTECNIAETEIADFRGRELLLTAGASLSGLPQVSIPLVRVPHGPVGLGIIGPRNSDLALIRLAEEIANKVSFNDCS